MKIVKSVFIFCLVAIVSASCSTEYMASSHSNFPNIHLTENLNYNTIKAAYTTELIDTHNMIPQVESTAGIAEQEILNTQLEEQNTKYTALSYSFTHLINEAKSYLGTHYRLGGTTRKGIDCSGFTMSAFGSIGISLPRTAVSQSELGTYVNKSSLKVGDLLFFHTRGRYVSHVAIVEKVENGLVYFIHASSSKGVIISTLDDSYWSSKYLFAKRLSI